MHTAVNFKKPATNKKARALWTLKEAKERRRQPRPKKRVSDREQSASATSIMGSTTCFPNEWVIVALFPVGLISGLDGFAHACMSWVPHLHSTT